MSNFNKVVLAIIKISYVVFIITVITSCDCLQHVQGTVIDSETQLPIANVKILDSQITDSLHILKSVIYTDSLGKFEFTSKSVGILRCPKILLSFDKKGYKETTKKYKSCCSENETVILKKK